MPLTRWYTLNHTSHPKDGKFWALEAAFDTDDDSLYIRFKSGVVCKYELIHPKRFESLISAPSAGQWVHRYIYHYPYTVVPAPG